MKPHITVKNKPINNPLNHSDKDYDYNEDIPELYFVIVSEGKLKIVFTVLWQDPKLNDIEFKVVRKEHLYLDGQDNNIEYPPQLFNGKISADPTLVQNHFKDSLEKYGIFLNSVINHNFLFFETIDYIFTDFEKEEELYSLINEACKKIKHNPISLG